MPARNPFDGYYAAIGGGYGVGSGRDASIAAGVFGSGGFTSSSGPNASFVFGRNVAIGWGLLGVEVDARWEGERAGSVRDNGVFTYNYKNDVGVHAAIRAGATFDDLLIYAKAGVGAARVRESFVADERALTFCTFDPVTSTCVLMPGTLHSARTAAWLPSAVFGVGLEQNWGPVFGRLSADFEAFNHSTTTITGPPLFAGSSASQLMWSTRGTAMVGFRF
jgi:hypothetical protein